MRLIKSFLALVMVLVFFSACETTPTGGENGTEIDIEKSERLVASADSVVMEMINAGEGGSSSSVMMNYMKEAEQLYKEAIGANPGNSHANFGAALFGFQSILDHPDIKMIKDTLKSWDEDIENLDHAKYYVTQYFMHGMSGIWMNDEMGGYYQQINPFSAFAVLLYFVQNSLTNQDMIALIQNSIDNTLIAELDESIGYMDAVLSDDNFTFILSPEMTDDDNAIELDSGEAYMISAIMHMLRGSLKIMNAYKLSVPGTAGISDYINETTILPLIKNQDENNGAFLTLRNNTILPSAKQDLIDVMTMVENGVNFIKSETDDQINDIIPKQDITETDVEIDTKFSDVSSDIPIPLLRGASGIVNLAEKIKTMLSGPFVVEGYNKNGELITISVDFSNFLDNGIPDIKDVLPYHEWIDFESLQLEFQGPGIRNWTEHYADQDISVYEFDIIGFYSNAYYEKTNQSIWEHTFYVGSFSENGVFTAEGSYNYDSGFEELNADALITNDGAFYLDQNRLCITQTAYDTINSYLSEIPNDDWRSIYTFYYVGSMPRINFSLEHLFGVRNQNGVFGFSGSTYYSQLVGSNDYVYLVDNQGNIVEKPIFPDPTFGGVLPGMTQDKLMQLK